MKILYLSYWEPDPNEPQRVIFPDHLIHINRIRLDYFIQIISFVSVILSVSIISFALMSQTKDLNIKNYMVPIGATRLASYGSTRSKRKISD
ncbi:hypothetical protein F8M41_026237 [Gigaspora margarita]|uniref:Uncharacterized protein n=1 Tax=Gigaspora margarita TaxID=4874 RepID=A0A8H4AZS1_GIGMA|nr:hypothetical protein F8M41_026237 [Gigaspora margarita]